MQDFSQFAYQLSMRFAEIHICGASIIALQWALTAGELTKSIIGSITVFLNAHTGHCFEHNDFAYMVKKLAMNELLPHELILFST